MTSRDFVFWLQGYFELMKADKNVSQSVSPQQIECIERHLSLVFKHEIDPSMGPQTIQDVLNQTHGASKPVGSGSVTIRC